MKADTGLKHFRPLVHYECKSKHLKGNAHKRPLRSYSFLPVVCCLLVIVATDSQETASSG